MRKFRFRWKQIGNHIHIRLFVGYESHTFAKCGDLCMELNEFHEFKAIGTGACEEMVEFVEEDS